jgi:DNA-binding response OmpR family regulator
VTNPDLPGRIVVVDDDPTVADVVGRYLVRDGHTVECVHDGHEALRRIAEQPPDLVVLDLMLPGIDGLEVCRRLRERWPIPVVMLTALGDETDRLAGFEIGADDYVTKPFSPRELVLRVQAILRRGARAPERQGVSSYGGGAIVIDEPRRTVTVRGIPVQLTPTEWGILGTLATVPGRVYSRFELINKVRGYEFEGYERTVDSHVKNLRRKVEEDPGSPRVIMTVLGGGYRLGLARDD